MRIQEMQNLGPKSAEQLMQIGIKSDANLKRMGARKAFLKLRKAGLNPSLNFLYAMQGALELRHWASFSNDERFEMDLSVNRLKASFKSLGMFYDQASRLIFLRISARR